MVAHVSQGDATRSAQFNEVLREWSKQWSGRGLIGAIEHTTHADDRGHFHWLVRVKGDEKDVITIWLSLRQRSVYVETEVMPAPEENHELLYRFLLVKNATLREVHVAIGPEDGIYLMTSVAVNDLDVERLDQVVGACVAYVDEIYPTAMSMGLASVYRRRPTR